MTSSIVDGRSGSDKVSELAREHPSLVTLARAGWIAKGVVYGLVGVLAVPIAINGLDRSRAASADEEASQLGAIGEIADTSWGTFALWLVAIGLLLYVAWRAVSIALPARNTAKTWATRAGWPPCGAKNDRAIACAAISAAPLDAEEGSRPPIRSLSR